MLNPELLQKIKMVAPGTMLRRALDDMLSANLGALIGFLGDIKTKGNILQGGFYIGSNFSPQKLYELAKMDGAIIIDEDVSRILAANVHLTPDNAIPTNETGMRHRAAERMARQTGNLMIAISKRKRVVTIFYKDYKYELNNIGFLITSIGQAISSLDRYKENMDRTVFQIDTEEFADRVHLISVVEVLAKASEIMKTLNEIGPYVIEAGIMGRSAGQQFQAISTNTRGLISAFVMDYSVRDFKDSRISKIIDEIVNLEPLGSIGIANILGWRASNEVELQDLHVRPRGYRLLKYAAKLPLSTVRNVVKIYKNMLGIVDADFNTLIQIDGIGEKRADAIISSIKAIRNRIAYG